ncbi:phage tail tube protein [Oceanobacter kriegii]|uniref:phage tail tube protein n=1 Tax=Oceanobacter kriegii TaxID=64972 RepID=UPI0003FA2C13|nr:phage tail tube protein [Oceanobacter kriegii]
MAKVARKIILDVPGVGRVESIENSGRFNPGGVNRDPITTDTGSVHYSEATAASQLNFRAPNLPGYLEALRDLSGVNVNVQDDNGQAWIINGAFTTTPSELQSGEITVQMQGAPAEPV